MTHPPPNPKPIGVIAHELHEHARQRIPECPTWEDLDFAKLWRHLRGTRPNFF
jgi:hypothetical protein